jgi:hypothetical protein
MTYQGGKPMAQPMLADGRAHDIVPASEGELLDELRQ